MEGDQQIQMVCFNVANLASLFCTYARFFILQFGTPGLDHTVDERWIFDWRNTKQKKK